ncbi:MAG: hypothetical protein WAL64_05170 [Candidatus Dormiibacterota bacterium]
MTAKIYARAVQRTAKHQRHGSFNPASQDLASNQPVTIVSYATGGGNVVATKATPPAIKLLNFTTKLKLA